jgi:hypothetical protein
VRRSVGVALVVVTALALLAGALSRREPVRRVATPTVKVKGKSADPASSPGTAVSPEVVPDGARPAPVAPKPERILLVGDSVAFSLKDQLTIAAWANGIALYNASVSGCSVIGGITTDTAGTPFPWSAGCADGIPKYHEQMIAMFQPQLVVWLSAWDSVDRILDDGTWARFGTFEGNQAIIAEIDEAAQRLTAGGARLVIVTLPPPPPDAPDKHEAAVNLPLLNTLLRGYAHDHPDKVFVAEMAELLCSTDTCPSNVDGMVPRPDGVHFDDTHSGRWVADQLIPMLLAPVIPADPGTRETRAPATPG